MRHTDIDFTWFEWREKALRSIYRYSNFKDFYYRSDLYTHSLRIFYTILSQWDFIIQMFPNVSLKKTLVMALVHDDVEILIWDFQSANRLNLDQETLDILDNRESEGIKTLSKKFPRHLDSYIYETLLTEIFEYSSTEAQLVKFFDHLDAFWEALHEYFAGNQYVVTQVVVDDDKIVLPFDYYINMFQKAEDKYLLLKDLLRKKQDYYTPFSLDFERIDFEWTVKQYSPHTRESIKKEYPYEFYNFRKDAVLESKENEIITPLIEFSKGRFTQNKVVL